MNFDVVSSILLEFLNFYVIPVVQEYLNEIAPTLNGPNKLKTSGKPQRIADLQPLLQDKTNRTPCMYAILHDLQIMDGWRNNIAYYLE